MGARAAISVGPPSTASLSLRFRSMRRSVCAACSTNGEGLRNAAPAAWRRRSAWCCLGSAWGGYRGDAAVTPVDLDMPATVARAGRPGRLRHRENLLWGAALLHRLSGLGLALFLPVHFLTLALALDGELRLDGVLAWSEASTVKLGEGVWCFCSRSMRLAGCGCWRSKTFPGMAAKNGSPPPRLFCRHPRDRVRHDTVLLGFRLNCLTASMPRRRRDRRLKNSFWRVCPSG